jgi:hypothetical protein
MTFFSEENMNKIIDYEYNNLPAKYNGSTKSEERDVVMSERLRELRQNNEGNGMHIGGVSHMFGNYHNLYERLADLSPTRYRLSEFSPTIFS